MFQDIIYSAMKANDFDQFSSALKELAIPLNPEQRKKVKSVTITTPGPHTDSFEHPTDAELAKDFPLPLEHEINQPFDESADNEKGNTYDILRGRDNYNYLSSTQY